MLTIEEGALSIGKTIEQCLATNTGCLIGRNGSTELTTLFYMDAYHMCTAEIAQNLQRFSGIFPSTVDTVRDWALDYKASLAEIGSAPVVAGWFEPMREFEMALLRKTCREAPQMPLRCLEPYYVGPELRWTRLLASQKVAVVSSFADTIRKQIPRASQFWGAGDSAESLLPSTAQWFPIQTGFPSAIAKGTMEWPASCKNWADAVDKLEREVVETGAQICLIGCGGLGMILGARLKARGIVCIVMGGAIQVLFGIKGQRWQTHSVISKFWNSAWVWPSVEEVPRAARLIEGGCYWNTDEKN